MRRFYKLSNTGLPTLAQTNTLRECNCFCTIAFDTSLFALNDKNVTFDFACRPLYNSIERVFDFGL